MKKIKLGIYSLVITLLALTGCSKETNSGTPEDNVERIEFDYLELATMVNTDFEECLSLNESSLIGEPADDKFIVGSYVRIDNTYIPLNITFSKDIYGNIESIYAEPVNQANGKIVWNYFLANADDLHLGTFVGTKYKSASGSGLLQSVAESVTYVENNDIDNSIICAIFSIISGHTYFIPMFEKGNFGIKLTNSYLTLDYDVVSTWINGDYSALSDKYYILGNKLSAWGQNYIYFYYSKDMLGNMFHVDVNGDENSSVITSISSILDYEYHSDADEQLAIWKKYALGDEALNLGTFKSAYKSSFGSTIGDFGSQQEVVEYVEKNGRPGGFDPDIVVTYDKNGLTLYVTLKNLYLYVDIKP